MNEYIAIIADHLTPVQIEVVNRIDDLLPKLGPVYHLGELSMVNWENVDDIPGTVLELYQYYLDRETAELFITEDAAHILDQITMAETVAGLLFGESNDLIEEHKDLEEDEFFHAILAETTDKTSVYWEGMGDLTSDTYRKIIDSLVEETNEDDAPPVDETVLQKAKDFFANASNVEALTIYQLTISSSTIPIDFDNALAKLSAAYPDPKPNPTLTTEVEGLVIVTDAENVVTDWHEKITNVLGFYPSDTPVADNRF